MKFSALKTKSRASLGVVAVVVAVAVAVVVVVLQSRAGWLPPYSKLVSSHF